MMENSNDDRLVLPENSDSQSNSIEQPRQPRNLEDLLRYAIEAESQSNSEHRPDIRPMNRERRQFLEDVISTMTVNATTELKKFLDVLQGEYKDGDSTEEFVNALEHITDLTDNIDVANDFFKLGGFDVCKTWMEKGPSEIRWRSAAVIGECCQNNLFCQSKATETGLLKHLMDIALNDDDDMVKLKSFHAVSCIVRNNDLTLLNFLTLNGHKLIFSGLKSPNNKLKTKAAFFTSAIANKEEMLLEQLWDIGVVNELVSLITGAQESELVNDVSCFEQCLSALLCLVKATPKKLKDSSAIVISLTRLQVSLVDQPAYQESVEYIKAILQAIGS